MKERVRIGRVWTGYDPQNPETEWVRCHPLHGGKHFVTTTEEFLKRYEQEV